MIVFCGTSSNDEKQTAFLLVMEKTTVGLRGALETISSHINPWYNSNRAAFALLIFFRGCKGNKSIAIIALEIKVNR
jgi:hypothetical protein